MYLQSLSLTNFKNIPTAQLTFSPKINCFIGNNGMGKSNLLDALYYLSFCKSFTGMTDAQIIRHEETFAMLKGNYRRRGIDEEITAAIQQGKRKSFRRSGKEYQRLSEHIGAFPLVILSPADMDLITGAADIRRRFIDQIISQDNPRYFDSLIGYNHAIEQRNRMLRENCPDKSLFDAIELQMDMYGNYLTLCRQNYIQRISDIFQHYYTTIAGGNERVAIAYKSQLTTSDTDSLGELLNRMRRRDEILHFTSVGPHRDDIEMTLDGMPVRRTASQGQAKTFVCALRFAQYELLKNSLGISPLLLLDDIFDKLDHERVSSIMALVGRSDTFGQIFITDTNRRHLDEIIADIPVATPSDNKSETVSRLWNVSHGTFSPVTSNTKT